MCCRQVVLLAAVARGQWNPAWNTYNSIADPWNAVAPIPTTYAANSWDPWNLAMPMTNMGVPMDTPAVMAAKADHAAKFRMAQMGMTAMPMMRMAMPMPMPVDDTLEVKAAKAEFMAKFRMAEAGMPIAKPMMMMGAPMPVDDTPEVKAAKAEFMAKFRKAEMGARRKRALVPVGVVGLSHTPASTALLPGTYISRPRIFF